MVLRLQKFIMEKKLSELSLAQKAMIASLPKAPSRIKPIANPRRDLSEEIGS